MDSTDRDINKKEKLYFFMHVDYVLPGVEPFAEDFLGAKGTITLSATFVFLT